MLYDMNNNIFRFLERLLKCINITSDPVSYTHLDVYKRQDTPFDESRKGVMRVNLDITSGSGARTRLEHGKGLLGKDREVIVARLDCVIPVSYTHLEPLARRARGRGRKGRERRRGAETAGRAG